MAPVFVDGPVRVSVPATSANLGPGYDTLGLALDLRDELEGEVLASGLEVQVTGAGEGTVPLDESHLVVRSMRAAFTVLGEQPPGLRLTCHNVVPHARGLGSSSAAIVGGLVLARTLVTDGAARLPDDALVDLASRIEGHPDNVAPALLGGFVVAGADEVPAGEEPHFFAIRGSVDPRIGVVVLVPPTPVSTEAARGLLPAEVPHADAAANSGRAALLVAALTARPDQLLRATRDVLHQEYRRPAMPESLALIDRLRAEGVPAIVSGAGPTVLAFVDAADEVGIRRVLDTAPDGWWATRLAVDLRGALVV
ncbi:homoserine kinase [Nocardioides acrostichi]|uniref:Homoserine kinase n=1 Tax=Nocardioides acrostichi TaxID=2784339 RepID=A0A930V420_9ACTN|nr:homoserine kinase [Nocardioides acrostichi]MBF4162829.1 homoserine kinase [Nocardioides acrostichi]